MIGRGTDILVLFIDGMETDLEVLWNSAMGPAEEVRGKVDR